MKKLLENAATDGIYSEGRRRHLILRKQELFTDETLYIWGDFNGATVEIQFSPDSVNWFTPPDGTFTADAMQNFSQSAIFIRAKVSGAGVGTNISATIM